MLGTKVIEKKLGNTKAVGDKGGRESDYRWSTDFKKEADVEWWCRTVLRVAFSSPGEDHDG